jgi:hypothetical protein
MNILCITPNLKQDYIAELVIEGLKKTDYNVFFTDYGNGVEKVIHDNEIKNINFDYIFSLFSKIRDNKPPKNYLLDKFKNISKVYIDGSEWSFNAYPEKDQIQNSLKNPSFRKGKNWIDKDMYKKCNFYFKRECYLEDIKMGIIPFPFGLLDKHIKEVKYENKIYDIFCCFGHELTGLRKEVTEYCKWLKNNTNYKIIIENKIPKEQYEYFLKNSKICIDAWGGGDCCDRFWEGIGNKCTLLYQKYNIEIPDKYSSWKNAVEFSTLEEFKQNINILLNNDSLCENIARNGFEHAIKYHTSKKRIEYIFNKISNNIISF